jgi:hypothetical protein
MNRAQIERLTQLALAAQGKPTKRTVKEILAGERSAAAKYIPRTSLPSAGKLPPESE